ncbi:pyridoxamine 5'-phosphate oxidase family protein [Sodalis sp. RH15]|uniref:pyridoxamine 5'-phosphate oxidase family protein n=1 Tax=Sodalis sp. RH15 TaxID=3394330 RepID=UPI0039B6133E
MTSLERSLYLLETAHFFSLASRSDYGAPWSSTLNFVTAFSPLRIIWSSMQTARHSQDIRLNPHVSGSLFRADLQNISQVGLDGAQFTGAAREIPFEESEETYNYFSVKNFPQEAERQQWMLPLNEFRGKGTHRFYDLHIEKWWLLDIEGWLATKEDKKLDVDVSLINSAQSNILTH